MDEGVDLLTGLVAAIVAGLLVVRVARGVRVGEMPLYRTRVTRGAMGPGKFAALVGFNAALALAMGLIAVDLLLGLGLRG